MSDFTHVKPGNTVKRMLAGTVPVLLRVAKVDEQFIYCGTDDCHWKFDRKHGYEVDEELGWGVPRPDGGSMVTGSYLVPFDDSDLAVCKKCNGTGFYKREWGRSLTPHPCDECPK